MMFTQNYQARVTKHLGVFQRAVEGLRQVQNDIREEVTSRLKQKQELAVAIKDHEAEIAALNQHKDQIGDTISKINVLLPKGASNV